MTIDSIATTGTGASVKSASQPVPAPRSTVAASVGHTDPVKEPPTPDELQQAVTALNASPQARSQGLEFSVDSDSQRTVVKVIDQSTREVLRQIPTPEALDIAKALEARSTRGVLLQQTA